MTHAAIGKKRKGKGPATRKQRNAARDREQRKILDERRRLRNLEARLYTRS